MFFCEKIQFFSFESVIWFLIEIEIMKRITKFKRSIRAISPVIATYVWELLCSYNGNAILIQSLTTDQDSNLVLCSK